MSTRNKIRFLRTQAFLHQHGRCFYCQAAMWLNDPTELPGLPVKGALTLRCTAEHLIPRCDRGGDEANNIVAACARCNHGRHKLKHPPSPSRFAAHVHNRLIRGRWHHPWVWKLGLVPPPILHSGTVLGNAF